MIDFTKVINITVGGDNIVAIYDNSGRKIWGGVKNYAYITLTSSAAQTVYVDSTSQYASGTVYYSTDKIHWNEMDSTPVSFTGDLYVNGDNSIANKFVFGTDAEVTCSGNVMALVDRENPSTAQLSDYQFKDTFNGASVLKGMLTFPATELSVQCYQGMFRDCTKITTVPTLPATILKFGCYAGMFYNTSITSSVDLSHVTQVDVSCCESMYKSASKLATVSLPSATTLANYCYSSMYHGTAVTSAPTITADSIPYWGCYSMYYGCTSLKTMGDINVSSIGTSGCEGMFAHCSTLVTGPDMSSVTSIGEKGCVNMFYNCIALKTAGAMSNVQSVGYEGCYKMYYGCTSLTAAPDLSSITTVDEESFYLAFRGCSSLKTASVPSALTVYYRTYCCMYQKCTSLTTVPSILPATTLANSCYQLMFEYCEKITTTPELPALTVPEQAYEGMFQLASSVNKIVCHATSIEGSLSVSPITYGAHAWTNQVASTGTFYKNKNMSGWLTDNVNGIPPGWTAVDIEEPEYQYLTFTSTGDQTIALDSTSPYASGKVYYSTDKTTWNELTSTPVSFNGEIYVNGVNSVANEFKFMDSTSTVPHVDCTGNIMCLVDRENPDTATLSSYQFMGLFKNCWMIDSTITLPANTLAGDCYTEMFAGCTGLTNAPALPAMNLAVGCYQSMFEDCTGLTNAPALPATTIPYYAYAAMFEGCTGLTQAPELPALTVPLVGYQWMFSGCTSLNYIKCNATKIDGDYSVPSAPSYGTYMWTAGVASTGTFYKNSAATQWGRTQDGIPSGWTVVNY